MITFDDIFSQPVAVDALRRAIAADRLHHGLIFAGQKGVGKATTARALGGWFLCESPQGDRPCGRCGSCRGFEGDAVTHPDYHVIVRQMARLYDKTGKSKARDVSAEVIRQELNAKAANKSVMGRGKVFVVEEAETMNPTAQNSMLKTLEEPAGRTVIILLTDQLGSLLPTIRSRCQAVRFAALPDDVVRRELAGRGVDPQTAANATALAEGSLGVALKWIADGVVDRARDLLRQADDLADGRPFADLEGWFKAASEAYAVTQLKDDELASKDQATREGLTLYLRLTAARFRRTLRDAHDSPDALEAACGAIDAIARAEEYLDANVNTALALQQLAVALERQFVRV